MANNETIDKLLRNKKVLFAGAAACGGLLSGILCTMFLNMNSAFLSWVVTGALDAAFIGAAVVYAQNYYQTKSFKISSGLKQAIKKGLLIGSIGGIGALVAMYVLGSGNFGRFIGWGISGGVAGYVVSGQVPNLKQSTAIWAGAIGAMVGCMAMFMDFGYSLGVATTGAAIGLMVAVAEVMFRKNWLDVEIYSAPLGTGLNLAKPIHQFTVTLGKDPITVGTIEGMDVQYKYDPAAATPHAASIYVEGEKTIFHDLASRAKTELVFGTPFRFDTCQIRLGS